MLIDAQYNTLFHRSVNRDNEPYTLREVFNSPSVYPLYKNKSFENPLLNYLNLRDSDNLTFGTYNNNPVKWRVLNYDSVVEGLILISDVILFLSKFDTTSNIWSSSYIRGVLNGSFYNNTFSNVEKSFIKGVITESGTSDKVFLLGGTGNYKYQNYFDMSTNTNRIARYNGSYKEWWLRNSGSYISSSGNQVSSSSISSNYGIRPVIVVSPKAFSNNPSIMNPLYSERVWGFEHYPFSRPSNLEDKNVNYYSVSEQISKHNAQLQGKKNIPDIYDDVRGDFALFTMGSSLNSYNYVFRDKVDQSPDIEDGIYMTYSSVFIVKEGSTYSCGTVRDHSIDTMDSVFFSLLKENESLTTFPEKAIYASCWEDLNPFLELYMPHKNLSKVIFWLGKKFKFSDKPEDIVDTEIYNYLNDLVCKNYTQFI